MDRAIRNKRKTIQNQAPLDIEDLSRKYTFLKIVWGIHEIQANSAPTTWEGKSYENELHRIADPAGIGRGPRTIIRMGDYSGVLTSVDFDIVWATQFSGKEQKDTMEQLKIENQRLENQLQIKRKGRIRW